MNQHTDDDIPPFDDPAHEREWLAQESAMRRERLQLDPVDDDARGRRYRLLARVLREPLPEALPADFAQQVAARVASVRQPTSVIHFEFALLFALAAALVASAGIVTAIYGRAWLQQFSDLLPPFHAPTLGWLLALGGCLATSWLLGRWHQPPTTATPL
ncbi:MULTISPECIES: hypothetical protein [Rhodanobacter]|uniref:hypothetical protein n=1 Tax=Rhodanobacter TaxID=75309 RepID=UPI0003FD83B2|nr:MULTISPECIES: hypothetical protein [Rhodanobacter]TAN18899.1 MAG: hypothetical protein EPN35_02705 [Rhodanobacter sp.]UJJ55607.1 hypothetical protein LRK53_04200 [Rhodanobacter thiooxydans]